MAALVERAKQALGVGSKQFEPISLDRHVAMLEDARKYALYLENYQTHVLHFRESLSNFINVTGNFLLDAPSPKEYSFNTSNQLGPVEPSYTSDHAILFDPTAHRAIPSSGRREVMQRIDNELLLPIEQWLVAFKDAEARLPRLNSRRFKVDSERRKVEKRLNKAYGKADTALKSMEPRDVDTQGDQTRRRQLDRERSTVSVTPPLGQAGQEGGLGSLFVANKKAARLAGVAQKEFKAAVDTADQRLAPVLPEYEAEELYLFSLLSWLCRNGTYLKAYFADVGGYMVTSARDWKPPQGLLLEFPGALLSTSPSKINPTDPTGFTGPTGVVEQYDVATVGGRPLPEKTMFVDGETVLAVDAPLQYSGKAEIARSGRHTGAMTDTPEGSVESQERGYVRGYEKAAYGEPQEEEPRGMVQKVKEGAQETLGIGAYGKAYKEGKKHAQMAMGGAAAGGPATGEAVQPMKGAPIATGGDVTGGVVGGHDVQPMPAGTLGGGMTGSNATQATTDGSVPGGLYSASAKEPTLSGTLGGLGEINPIQPQDLSGMSGQVVNDDIQEDVGIPPIVRGSLGGVAMGQSAMQARGYNSGYDTYDPVQQPALGQSAVPAEEVGYQRGCEKGVYGAPQERAPGGVGQRMKEGVQETLGVGPYGHAYKQGQRDADATMGEHVVGGARTEGAVPPQDSGYERGYETGAFGSPQGQQPGSVGQRVVQGVQETLGVGEHGHAYKQGKRDADRTFDDEARGEGILGDNDAQARERGYERGYEKGVYGSPQEDAPCDVGQRIVEGAQETLGVGEHGRAYKEGKRDADMTMTGGTWGEGTEGESVMQPQAGGYDSGHAVDTRIYGAPREQTPPTMTQRLMQGVQDTLGVGILGRGNNNTDEKDVNTATVGGPHDVQSTTVAGGQPGSIEGETTEQARERGYRRGYETGAYGAPQQPAAAGMTQRMMETTQETLGVGAYGQAYLEGKRDAEKAKAEGKIGYDPQLQQQQQPLGMGQRLMAGVQETLGMGGYSRANNSGDREVGSPNANVDGGSWGSDEDNIVRGAGYDNGHGQKGYGGLQSIMQGTSDVDAATMAGIGGQGVQGAFVGQPQVRGYERGYETGTYAIPQEPELRGMGQSVMGGQEIIGVDQNRTDGRGALLLAPEVYSNTSTAAHVADAQAQELGYQRGYEKGLYGAPQTQDTRGMGQKIREGVQETLSVGEHGRAFKEGKKDAAEEVEPADTGFDDVGMGQRIRENVQEALGVGGHGRAHKQDMQDTTSVPPHMQLR